MLIGLEIRGIRKNIKSYRNCENWSDNVAVKLPKTILETTKLEKLLSTNILKLLFTLVYGKEKNEVRLSLGTH